MSKKADHILFYLYYSVFPCSLPAWLHFPGLAACYLVAVTLFVGELPVLLFAVTTVFYCTTLTVMMSW